MANTVEFRDVKKRFGQVTAIDGVSFSIAGGETVALLGPSGCGKTTILRMIAGFESPNAGVVLIGGADMTRLKPYERNVGLLFQHYALFPHMTVAENVAYGLRHRGVDKKDIPSHVAEMLDLVRLPAFGGRRPDQLSGGQQQRVALARALATKPGLVLLDEPLSALDAKLRQDLRAELKQVLAAVDATTIVVTHDQEEAMSLGERVFVMKDGRIVQAGPPNEVYSRPQSRFVADFMGRANWFSGRIADQENGLASFASSCGTMFSALGHGISGDVELCIRPESIDLEAAGQGDAPPGRNRLDGHVVDVALLGATRQILVELPGGSRVLAVEPNRFGVSRSLHEPVCVGFAPDACVILPANSAGTLAPSAH